MCLMAESMRLRILWWLMLVVVWFNQNGCCLGCWPKEKIGLLQLKANYINLAYLPSWVETDDEDCCEWERVECNITSRRVVMLHLNGTFLLDRHFNASLFLPFKELRILDLSSNVLGSWEENEGFDKLKVLSNLKVLNLDDNIYDNKVLPSVGVLSSLETLSIRNNILLGTINFQDLHNLTNLEELDLSHNYVDSIVTTKGDKSLSKLLILDLRGDDYVAGVLRSVRAFPSLKSLSVRINGSIAEGDFEGLNKLEKLYLGFSKISGSFLQYAGKMTSLKILSLYDNGLSGNLPAEGWCNLQNLEALDLSNNDLEGMLPSCLGNLTSLRYLDLSFNNFSGALSPLSNLISLEFVTVSNNHFRIPFSFGLFANNSKLKFFFGDSNACFIDKLQPWVPRFQLKIISLSNCMIGTLPYFLQHQNDLRGVDFSHNMLDKFPTWLLDNNTRLGIIIIRNSSLAGPFLLPRNYINPLLSTLELSDNHITSQIPFNLSVVFPNLKYLNLSSNMIDGNIPSSFGDLKLLVTLDLSNNYLSGAIPENLIVGCTQLSFLKLSNNDLQGPIFSNNFNLTNLKLLYLNNNHFVGRLPNSLSNTSLYELDVSDNHITGMIPPWLGHMTTIYMARNQLEGPIPVNACNTDFLDLSENSLSGLLPRCSDSSSPTYVRLNKNRLTGPWIHTFNNSPGLAAIDLSDNLLTGTIPDWIDTLFGLRILILRGNQFEGGIPTQLCHLNQLSLIDLSHNYLSGYIPQCLVNIHFEVVRETSDYQMQYGTGKNLWGLASSMTGKEYLVPSDLISSEDMFDEEFSLTNGQNEVEFTTKSRSQIYKGSVLDFMSGLDLSANQLIGEIPQEFGNLIAIRSLNLSYNKLVGSIPQSFSNIRNVESLDLSHNKLNGSIPSQLTELNYLAVFSVAYNNLSGKTPDMKAQFATFNKNSYEGNRLLCGPPLDNSCSSSGSPRTHSVEENDDIESTDMGDFYVTFLVSYTIVLFGIAAVLFINPYWRRAWFHLVDECIISCYYFVVDCFHKLFKRRNV